MWIYVFIHSIYEFPWWIRRSRVRCNVRDLGSIPWRMKWQSTAVFLPGKSHGWRSLAGYSPRGRQESDMTSYRVPSPETPPSPRWSVSSDWAVCAGCTKDGHLVPLKITFIASLNFMVSLSHCFRAPARLAEVLPDLCSNSIFLSVQLCFLLQVSLPFMAFDP